MDRQRDRRIEIIYMESVRSLEIIDLYLWRKRQSVEEKLKRINACLEYKVEEPERKHEEGGAQLRGLFLRSYLQLLVFCWEN